MEEESALNARSSSRQGGHQAPRQNTMMVKECEETVERNSLRGERGGTMVGQVAGDTY
jgi:hypothetical protein